MIVVDCDVIVADGGTRTASITGGFIALALAVESLLSAGLIERTPLRESVAAVSVGIVGGVPILDLDYAQDSSADVDMNVVATGSGHLVEVQGTGERRSFSRPELDARLDLAFSGVERLVEVQRDALGVKGIALPGG